VNNRLATTEVRPVLDDTAATVVVQHASVGRSRCCRCPCCADFRGDDVTVAIVPSTGSGIGVNVPAGPGS